MEQTELIQEIKTLETRLKELQSAQKKEHNSDVVYATKQTMGYSQLVEVRGGKLYVLSGMKPWNKELKLESTDIIEQLAQTMDNLLALLKSKNLDSSHLVSLRLYVAKPNYYEDMLNFRPFMLEKLGGDIACSMTTVGVTGLAEPDQLIEIEAIAAA